MIKGGTPLKGDLAINGAKNAILPILAASLLCEEECVLEQAPLLEDVFVMCEVLRHFGARVKREGSTLIVSSPSIDTIQPPEQLMKRIRASNLILGPLLCRSGEVHLPMPGGCAIGSRPMNYHLMALSSLGVELKDKGAYIEARTDRLKGADICLDFPSVGATENVIMAAARAEGVTTIRNAAREPEIGDLIRFLNRMGAKIKGAGTGLITIEGVQKLHGVRHQVMKDRIEAGTMMAAAVISGGDVFLRGVNSQEVAAVVSKLQMVGAEITGDSHGMRITCRHPIHATDIRTMPYPGFPTDMQPQFMALMAKAKGTSIITETIFENRFRHADEMRRMNADIKIFGDTAVVWGRNHLYGANVEATDLRAGAALVLLALAAEGITNVEHIHYIDRGYQSLEYSLQSLGAQIRREPMPVLQDKTLRVKGELCPSPGF